MVLMEQVNVYRFSVNRVTFGADPVSFEMLFILHLFVLICYSADGFPDLRLPYGV